MSEDRRKDVVQTVVNAAPAEGTEVLVHVDGKDVVGVVIGHLLLCTGWYRVKTADGRILTMSVPR